MYIVRSKLFTIFAWLDAIHRYLSFSLFLSVSFPLFPSLFPCLFRVSFILSKILYLNCFTLFCGWNPRHVNVSIYYFIYFISTLHKNVTKLFLCACNCICGIEEKKGGIKATKVQRATFSPCLCFLFVCLFVVDFLRKTIKCTIKRIINAKKKKRMKQRLVSNTIVFNNCLCYIITYKTLFLHVLISKPNTTKTSPYFHTQIKHSKYQFIQALDQTYALQFH